MEDDPDDGRGTTLPVGEPGLVGAVARLVQRAVELGGYARRAAPYDSAVARSCAVCLGVPSLGDPVCHGADESLVHPACLADEMERLAEDVRRLGSATGRR
jgi:hypothetical protein